MCRSIFTIEELLETIADPEVQNRHKAPYIKFLLWVYLKTESTAEESGTSDFSTNEELYGSLLVCINYHNNYYFVFVHFFYLLLLLF